MRAERVSPDRDEERFVAAYPALRRFAFVTADRDMDPEDLLHETLVRVLARRELAEIEDFEAFGRATMVNVASNSRRSLGRRRQMMTRFLARSHEPVEVSTPLDLGALLVLSSTDRAILYLVVVEGRPHAEAAELVGLSAAASRARMSRALKRLRIEQKEEGVRGDA